MSALPERKIAIVRKLVASAPDGVVGRLQQALTGTSDDSALGSVRQMVEQEVRERNLRNMVLLPIAPMCGPGPAGRGIDFAPRAFMLIWRGLRRLRPAEVETLLQLPDKTPPAVFNQQCDALTTDAAASLRAAAEPEFRQAAEACEAHRPGEAEELARCLDIGPVVRHAAMRLPEWLAHAGGETAAAARLAYKDAVAISDDAGPRFFHMLASQMAEPWMVLRVISAVMDKPTERYMRDSELAGFAESILDEVDAALSGIARFRPDEGPEAGLAAAMQAEHVLELVMELETCMDLQREQGWGLRIVKQRASLASVVEGRLRDAEKATLDALPTQSERQARIRRSIPKLSAPPDPQVAGRALTLLGFLDALHKTANYGGFGSVRAKVIERLSDYLHHYVEEVLDAVHAESPDALAHGEAFLALAADFSRLVAGEKAGELVRRRAFAALHPDAHMPDAAPAAQAG